LQIILPLESGKAVTTKPVIPASPPRTNRLAREKSPYLLQHAHNPVDWHAWNDEAFDKSLRENKPIFLSIGYSTCHWCHVMERESFENESVAAFLNAHFVSIKVDREERPDVDRIYMTFVQATTGQGGWPLNVFLTPDRKPFYGGTYFPPDRRPDRPGFLQLLQQIQQLWENRRDSLIHSATEVHARLEQAAFSQAPAGGKLTPEVLRQAGLLFTSAYDARHGGFGGAPKFPQPGLPQFLLRYARRFQDDDAIRMVLQTCDRMAAGGIHDQLGGGFARYAVDAEWRVPHFEKMLYDNAQLAQLYLDAHLVSGESESVAMARSGQKTGGASVLASPQPQDPSTARLAWSLAPPDYARVVRDILEYVLRDMTHPDGGFYSAEDADSEGHEGKFYCWTRSELEKLLSPAEFKVAVRYFGITEQGNFVDHSHPTPLQGQNVLSVVEPLTRPAGHPLPSDGRGAGGEGPVSGTSGAVRNDLVLLASAKRKMFDARAKRVRPHLDDKILASWNGLMLGAFARAYAVLGEESYRSAAEKNLAFLQAKLWEPGKNPHPSSGHPLPSTLRSAATEDGSDGRGAGGEGKSVGTLFHRWRDGERDNVQLLAGCAFLLAGVIDLYEVTLDRQHLEFAITLAESMLAKFYDAEHGGFWQSPADVKDLILRVKEDYDGAEPSGNSVAILALLKLGVLTGRREFTEAAEKSLRLFSARLRDFPQALPCLLQALDFSLQEPRRVVVAGDPRSAEARSLLRAIHSIYQPNKVVLGNTGPVEEFARTLPAKDGPVVYLCTGTSCQPPTRDPAKLKDLLQS
jgi:uncharacterized protein YyaL (SSP411 family)